MQCLVPDRAHQCIAMDGQNIFLALSDTTLVDAGYHVIVRINQVELSRPEAVTDYDIEHLTGDLIGNESFRLRAAGCRPRLGRNHRLESSHDAPPASQRGGQPERALYAAR